MPSLRKLQLGMACAVTNPRCASRYAHYLRRRGVRNEQRYQIYRNNLLVTLTAALEAVFPVIRRLVGADCFRNVALAYIRNESSRSGDIHDYGHRFAAFLETLPALDGYAYLPDVARLEWIYHSLFHSALLPALQPASLQQVPATRHADLCLDLQPASRLFASPFPVLRIWQVNQEDWTGAADVALDEGGVRLIALRATQAVGFVPLGVGEYTLLNALAVGMTLAAACELALEREPEFEPGPVLARHVALGTFTGWRL